MGPTQSGKTYFVQQILKGNHIVYEEQKSFEFISTTVNGKNVMKTWKSVSKKASGLEKVCPSCLKICVKLIPAITCGISTVYPKPALKRKRYLIATKHVSWREI